MAEPARTTSARSRRSIQRKVNRKKQSSRSLEDWVGWSGVALFLVGLCLVVLYALVLTHIRGEVVQLGYEIRNLADRTDTLQLEVNEHRLKRQELRSPERLQKLAGRLKLEKPSPDQIVVINDR